MAEVIPTLDPKDPGETLDYTWDFTNLLETAEIITVVNSAIVTPVTATPLVVDSQLIDVSGKKVGLFLSGGESCVTYTIAVNVSTDAATPRIFERSCNVPVEDR